MAIKERMSGNEAVSYAIRQINPDVMPAFPITPYLYCKWLDGYRVYPGGE